MALPVISDFITYIGKLLDDLPWDNNWQKVIDILTNGTYDLNVNKITAASFVGVPGLQINSLTAGENLLKGKACYLKLSDGLVYYADKSSAQTTDTFLGIVTADCLNGGIVTIERGMYTEFTGLTRGIYYLSTAGDVISAEPTTGVIRPIGLAINANAMLLNAGTTNSMYYGKGYVDYLSGNDLLRTQTNGGV